MIFIYRRVSTAEQAADGTTSLDQQQKLCEGYAMFCGAKNSFDMQVFTDAGVSGSIPIAQRPAGSDMLAAAKKGDTIVAAKLDRAFRDLLDALTTYTVFKERGVKLVLLDLGTDDIIAGAGMGKVLFSVLSTFADYERERIRNRMLDGKKAKQANGGHVGGEAPYGYRIVGEGREARLEEVPEEQEVMGKIITWHHNLQDVQAWPHRRRRAILGWLRQSGHKTREGKPWTATQVQRILDRSSLAIH